MVNDNVGNQSKENAMHNVGHLVGQNAVRYKAQAEGNSNEINGNQIRCYNCRGDGHYASNYTVKPRKRVAAYLHTQLQIAQKDEAGIQLNYKEFDFMAAAYGSAEVHLSKSCYDNDIFNMFTQEEQYTELLEPIPEPHKVPQNDSNVIFKVSSMEQGGRTVEQHPANVEETRVLYDSLYNNLSIEVEKVKLVNQKKKLKSDFKIREDELLDKQIQLENKIKELDNILVKTGQSIQTIHMLSLKPDLFYHTEQKMALDYKNPFYLKQAQHKQQSLCNGKVLLEKHDTPAVNMVQTRQPTNPPDVTKIIAQQLQNIIPNIMTQVTNNLNNGNGNGNGGGNNGCTYKGFVACGPRDFDGTGVLPLVTPEAKRVTRYINGLPFHIRGMLRATQPATIQAAILTTGILTNEAVRSGTLAKAGEKRKERDEASKSKSVGKDEKKAKGGRGFVAAVPPRRDNGNFPKDYKMPVRHAEPIRADPNVVTGTYTLNNLYAIVIFDSGADFSFISTKFVPLLNEKPSIANPRKTKTLMSTKANEPTLSNIPIVHDFEDMKEDHENHLRLMLDFLRKEKLYAKFYKCEFWLQEVHFLGHVVNHDDIHVDQSKIKEVRSWKDHTTPSEVRSFMGLAGYYRCFIENFSKIAKPLTSLTQKNQKYE
nr:putative reverse transcriptase domain-containing protein [Tanacetum cinerariifolium]